MCYGYYWILFMKSWRMTLKENRTEQISVAITSDEKKEWQEEASKHYMTLAAFVRYCVDIYFKAKKKANRQ